MADTVTTIYGWSLSQWSEAAGFFASHKDLPSPDRGGMEAVWTYWHSRWSIEPGGRKLIVEEKPPSEFDWAAKMAYSVMTGEQRLYG